MIIPFEKLLYLEGIRNCKDKQFEFELGNIELKKSVTEISNDLEREGGVFGFKPSI